MTDTLNTLFTFAVENGRRVFHDRGTHVPIILLHSQKAGTLPLGLEFDSPEGKRRCIYAVRQLLSAIRDIDCYVMIAEVWTLSDRDGVLGNIPPSKSERRQEALYIAGADRNGRHRCGQYAILRDEQGARLGEFCEMSSHKISGVMTNLFEPETETSVL